MSESKNESSPLDFDHSASALERAIEKLWVRQMIMGLIIINAIILGILTYRSSLPTGIVTVLEYADYAITCLFVVEIALKLVAYRTRFFSSGWNWFDFFVVGISIIPGAAAFSVLRAIRVLRVLRLLHVVPVLKRITEALLRALPDMGAIVAVLALITYVGAVMATNMFGNTDNPEVLLLFGDLPASAYSMFQVMTLDGWRFEVVQKVIDDGNPYAWIFFLTFIFLASFAVLNLFIALIVDALQQEQNAMREELLAEQAAKTDAILEEIDEIEEEEEAAHREREEMLELMRDMKAEISALKASIQGK